MRLLGTGAALIGVALALAACSSLDARYFNEGIGTTLPSPELADSTRLLDVYTGYICRQAGLAVGSIGDTIVCEEPVAGSRSWAMFVQAGMNDIDQRCDSYLAWLDNKRRLQAPILQQIQDTRTATEAIMRVAGAGANAIVVVGTAFGFGSATFANVSHRLVLEIDHSTVQTVVLTRQNDFRTNLPILIDNKAAAIYALRSYLRLCMPMTIETNINTTVKLFERGGLGALAAARARPMIDARLVRSAVIRDASVPISRPAIAVRNVSPTRFGSFEESLTERDIEEFQRAVCVKPPNGELGPIGSETRLAIQRALKVSDEVLTDRKGILLRRILRSGVTC